MQDIYPYLIEGQKATFKIPPEILNDAQDFLKKCDSDGLIKISDAKTFILNFWDESHIKRFGKEVKKRHPERAIFLLCIGSPINDLHLSLAQKKVPRIEN